jgi:hypothetical protein
MKPLDLQYANLKPRISSFEEKGRGESPAFLNWFLENIFRLDPVDADDAICDKANDRGIDGIYVDHNQSEIIVLQSKLKQREATVGDATLRDLAGSISQLNTVDSVQALIDGGGNAELKNVLSRNNIKGLVEKGYKVIGALICNQPLDANGAEFARQNPAIRIYDRTKIASEFIDIDSEGGIKGEVTFDASYVSPMEIQTSESTKTFILPIQASELMKMSGIDDGTLFSQNVRQSLGNTKVNKALQESVKNKDEHKNFPLYHNGINILCQHAVLENDKITVTNYVVVNGAQSISTFKKSASYLTPDLRVIAKIVELDDVSLARRITINSNNQNAIKPRDLKSTNDIQLRLRQEFLKMTGGEFDFEIKRGQESAVGAVVITNEEAGRLLLAFDLLEPESCHQIYKLFDDKYSDIFARPAVTAWRIITLFELMKRIQLAMEDITYRPLSKYGLTRFFLLSVVKIMIDSDETASNYMKYPNKIVEEGKMDQFCGAISEVLKSIIVDLNYEIADMGDAFDYKGDLKSPNKIRELRTKLLRSYEKDVARGKALSLGKLLT